jgi:hypothetical protein
MFDPYHEWLGLPRDHPPPTYYQLLGIAPTESSSTVIDEAALRQTARIRIYQTGVHAEECTRLLNEIAEARTVLVHPVKRPEYDARLRQAVPVPAPVAFGGEPSRQAVPPPLPLIVSAPHVGGTRFRLDPFAILYVLLLLLGGVLFFWKTSLDLDHQARPRSSPQKNLAPLRPRVAERSSSGDYST